MSTKPKKAPARTWHKGPPPHVGWWNASSRRLTQYWRWWDGTHWSGPAMESDSAADAGEWGLYLRPRDGIEWTDYYPADARVPRLDPAEGWRLNTGERPKHDGVVDIVFMNGHRRADCGPEPRWRWGITVGGHTWDIYAWRPAP